MINDKHSCKPKAVVSLSSKSSKVATRVLRSDLMERYSKSHINVHLRQVHFHWHNKGRFQEGTKSVVWLVMLINVCVCVSVGESDCELGCYITSSSLTLCVSVPEFTRVCGYLSVGMRTSVQGRKEAFLR